MPKGKEIEYILFSDPKKEYGWASNFYELKNGVKIDGETWRTTEAYFQAMKFRGKKATARHIKYSNYIRDTNAPTKVKMLGTQSKKAGGRFGGKWYLDPAKKKHLVHDIIDEYKDLKIRSDWEKVKLKVMVDAVFNKFYQYPELYRDLDVKSNWLFVESTSRDKIWGDGGDGGTERVGKNLLGKIVTVVLNVLLYGDCDGMTDELKKRVRIG